MSSTFWKPRVVSANTAGRDLSDQPFGSRGNRSSHHGWFMSHKLGANIPYEGLDAFHFLCLAEVHPAVRLIAKGADPINWFDGSTWRKYHPRYSIALRRHRLEADSCLDIEILSSRQVAAVRRQLRRVSLDAREEGRRLLVFTEKHINIEPRLTNAKLVLFQAGEGLVTAEERSLLTLAAERTEDFSLNEIVAAQMLTYDRAYATALNMVAAGELQFSLGRLFDGNSRIWSVAR